MASVIFKMNDGTQLEVDPGAPWSMREQVDWETQFKASFATVYLALGKEMEAAQIRAAAEKADETIDDAPVQHFRMTWMLWFGWHRLRREGLVASKWSVFFDTQLADYEFVMPNEGEAETAEAPEAAPAAVSAPETDALDPTASPSPSGPQAAQEPPPVNLEALQTP